MERKEEIILATLDLASENGLKSISMAQIAEKHLKKDLRLLEEI